MSLRSRLIGLGALGFLATAGAILGPMESGPKGPQLVPYDDIGGVPTWCYGETAGAPKARYTVPECDQLLLQSVRKHWDGIKHTVPENAPQSSWRTTRVCGGSSWTAVSPPGSSRLWLRVTGRLPAVRSVRRGRGSMALP
jgi:hypothetical protein